MAKVLIELKKDSFLDLYGNQYIMAGRPYVVNNTGAIQGLVTSGKASILGQLKDDASDEELVKAIKQDEKKGLEKFLAKFDAKAKEADKQPDGNKQPEENKQPAK